MEQRLFRGRVLGQPDTDMLREFRRRAETARLMEQHRGLTVRRNEARLQLEIEAVQVARGAVLRHAQTLDGEVLQSIIEEMDFEEGRLNRAPRGQSVARGSTDTPTTSQMRSTSASCAITVDPWRQAIATTRQSTRPRGVTPTRRHLR